MGSENPVQFLLARRATLIEHDARKTNRGGSPITDIATPSPQAGEPGVSPGAGGLRATAGGTVAAEARDSAPRRGLAVAIAAGDPAPGAAPPLDRAGLAPYVGECFHPARSSGQADVYYLLPPYDGWVLKDFSKRPLWMRVLMHRRILAREVRVLSALARMAGVPRLAGRVGADAIVMERLRAGRLPHWSTGVPSVEAFARIRAMVGEMHRRGWTHGDLRRKNILIDPEERPYLIDFATAFHAGPGAGPLRRWIFRKLERVDLITLARIKRTYRPNNLTDEERALLDDQPLTLRLGRWLKRRVYRPLRVWRKRRDAPREGSGARDGQPRP